MAKRKGISNGLRWQILQRDNFTCQYCGRRAPDVVIEVDHIIPVVKGGTNDPLNLITACYQCNHGKFTKDLQDEDELRIQEEVLTRTLKEGKEQSDIFRAKRESMIRQRKEAVEAKMNQVKTIFIECLDWPLDEVEEFFAETDLEDDYVYKKIEKKIRCRGFEYAYDYYFRVRHY